MALAFKVLINGADFPDDLYVKSRTLSIDLTEPGQRSVCNFTLIDKNQTVPFHFNDLCGSLIEVYENVNNTWILIFGGSIDEPETRKINNFLTFETKIVCVDHHFICDRIPVNQSYPKIKVHELFMLIVDDYLVDEGIWYDTHSIQETDIEVSIVCPYIFVSDIFDELVKLLNWQWNIGANKKLYLNDRINNNKGPNVYEYDRHLFASLALINDRSDFRTRQVLKNVHCLTDELTETASPYPDGVIREYKTIYTLEQKPRIFVTTWFNQSHPLAIEEVDPADIGIGGLYAPGSYKWYWNKNSNVITQDENEAAIAINLYVVIMYVGQFQIDIVRDNQDMIDERSLIENNTGLYVDVSDGSGITGEEIAEEEGDALLERYSKIMKKIKIQSYHHRFEPGQVCDCIIPGFNISSLVSEGNGYLVGTVRISDIGNKLLRSTELTDGELLGGWIAFFKKSLLTESFFEIRSDSVVSISFTFNEDFVYDEELNITILIELYPDVDLWPDVALYPGTTVSSNNYS